MTTIIIAIIAIVAIVAALVAGDNTPTAATVDADIDSTATTAIVDDWGFPTECRAITVAQTRALTVLPYRALVPAECRALVLAQESSQQAHNAAAYDIVMAQGVTATVSRTVDIELDGITDYTMKVVDNVTLWFVRAARDIDIDITTIVRHAVVRNCDVVDVTIVKNCTVYKRVLLDNVTLHKTIIVEGDVAFDNSRLLRGAVDGGGNTVIGDITVKDSSYTVDIIDARPLTIDVKAEVVIDRGVRLTKAIRIDDDSDILFAGHRYRKGDIDCIVVDAVYQYGAIALNVKDGFYPTLDAVETRVREAMKKIKMCRDKSVSVHLYGEVASIMSPSFRMEIEEAGLVAQVGYLEPIA